MRLAGRIQRWHWGKVVILWAWGGVIAALLLTNFLSSPVSEAPGTSSFTFFASVAVLAALTAITWRWLGGKEGKASEDAGGHS